MAGRKQASGALTIAAVVVGMVVVIGGAGATGVGSGTNHGASGDYTVFLPNEIDHYPGDLNRANGSIQHLAALDGTFAGTPSPGGYEAAGFLIIGNEDIDFSQCATENTAAFGLDRGNDADGTTTDESLLAHRENSRFDDHRIVIDFFDQGDLAGSPISINDVDEVVAVQNECYTMPSEPGWYQINGFLNGTGYNGNEFDVTLDSHYFYICECGSEQAAREQLGPPPSESGGAGGDGDDAPTPTPEPTATATATATPPPAADSPSTAEPTATATADAPGDSSTATPTAEPTATPDPGGDSPTATARGGDADGGDGAGAAADGDPSGSGSTATGAAVRGGSAPVTPTIGAGPGFGATAAIAGLALALLALRRD